jgi:hypothetical protein
MQPNKIMYLLGRLQVGKGNELHPIGLYNNKDNADREAKVINQVGQNIMGIVFTLEVKD